MKAKTVKLSLSIPSKIHAQVKARAKRNGRSLNAEIIESLVAPGKRQREELIVQVLHQLAVDMRAVRIATNPAPWTETVGSTPDRLHMPEAVTRNGGNGQ